MTLPIDPLKSEFIASLTHKHVVVSAATGSGKSTRLPLWASHFGRVLVVQPRRIACTSLAEYLAECDKSELGENIGYAIRFESHFNEQTQVVFATPGVVLRWFFENKLADFHVVMLDEFHERRWDMDLLLSLLNKNNKHRVIVTSATLETSKINHFIQGEVLHSEGRMFPVHESFLAAHSRAMPTKLDLSQRVCEACFKALEKSAGDILVFLPGKKEIQEAAATIKRCLKQEIDLGLQSEVIIIPLFSGANKQTQKLALSKQNSPRIILATNVAETSLTIPNVTCVIDSGLERRTHLRNGKTVLHLESIAKDSAKQRLGRAGRTQAGECIRLFGEHAPLIDKTPPEIQRESLNELVLAAGCADEGITQLAFLDPLPERSTERAVNLLTSLGALDDALRATELGKTLYPLPIDAELAHLILSMPSSVLKQAMIDLASVISVPAKVYSLPKSQEAQEQINLQLSNKSDLAVMIALVRGQLELSDTDQDALKEAQTFASQLRQAFNLPELEFAASYQHDQLLKAILKARPDLAYIKRQNRRGAYGNGYQEIIPAKETFISDSAEALLVLDTYALAGKGTKQAMTLGTVCAPLTFHTLRQSGLGEVEAGEAFIDGSGNILVEQIRQLAGVTIDSKTVNASGASLIKASVQLIEQNQLFDGLAKQLSEKINYTKLYYQAQQNASELNAIPSLNAWITKKLMDLGVETQEDLELIEQSDFAFEVLEEWELVPFIEKYPLQLNLPGLNVQVTYQFAAKRIRLDYLSGVRKDAPKRWELPSWNGFKIQYKKASKVVDIK